MRLNFHLSLRKKTAIWVCFMMLSTETKIGIKLTGDSDNICCLAEGEQINVIQSYETDKWYNIKLIINGKEKTFDIYSDNICKGKTLVYERSRKLTRIFRTEVLSCEAYFDDISVYTDSRTKPNCKRRFLKSFQNRKRTNCRQRRL